MNAWIASARWVVQYLVRQPLCWLWIALSAAAWPAILVLAPVGLIGGSGLEIALIYEVAFIGLTVGALLGGLLLERGGWFLVDRGPGERLVLELVALGAVSGLLVGPTLVAPLALRGADVLALLPALVAAHLHLSGLILVLLRLGLRAGPRAAALLIAVWLLPAVLDPETLAGRFVDSSLAAGRVLLGGSESVPHGPVWKERLGPIIGFVGAALLLRPQPPLHALRHPR